MDDIKDLLRLKLYNATFTPTPHALWTYNGERMSH